MAKRNEPEDPFADYVEWTQHLGIMAVASLFSAGPFYPEFGWELLASIGFTLLIAAAAVRMYFAK